MNDRLLNLLGMARRAGKLSIGHDASVNSLNSGKAKLCFLSVEASQRLKNEMDALCKKTNANIIFGSYTMQQLGLSVGAKATAVLTVNDEGFAKRIIELTREE